MTNPKIKILVDSPAEDLEEDFEEWKKELDCDINVLFPPTLIYNWNLSEFALLLTYEEVKDDPE